MNINNLIEGFLGSQAGGSVTETASQVTSAAKTAVSGMPGGLAGGALAGSVMALVLGTKKGRKYGGKALKYGGMAAIGGLAYKAYSNYQSKQNSIASTPIETNSIAAQNNVAISASEADFDPASLTDTRGQDMRLSLIQAMISAAKADGHIDAAENQTIMGEIDQMGFGAEEKSFLFDQLRAPSDPIAIANLSAGEEQSVELYLASLMAIDIDTTEEQRYLDRLGDALRLPDTLRSELLLHAKG